MKINNSILTNGKFLIAILFIGASLRLWNLGNVPPHLTPDEAALGYNAYSILKTGRDEYGKVLPFIFKSFGDYKPGLYIYLTVPFVAALGLNEFSVRLPSVIFGVLSILFIYLITDRLFKDRKLSLLSAFIASVTPWLIYFSRGAWEANVSLTLTLMGSYFFLRSLDKGKFIIHSAIFFSLTLLTYQGAKLSTGIVLATLIIVYWKEFWKIKNSNKIGKKYLFGAGILGLLVSLPIIISLFGGQTGRLNVFNVFSYPRPKEYTQAFLDEAGERFGDLNYYLFHSEALNFARGVMGRYFNHFSGKFLFFEGDMSNPRHTAPYQGMLLISDMILLVFGAYSLLKDKIGKEKLFIILWLVLSPLPAALSRDQVHAIRAMNMVVPLIIVLSFGLKWLLNQGILLLLFIPIYFFSFVYFLDAYFVHVPKHNSILWDYGYKQIVEIVTPIQKNYKTVKVQQSFAQPYIYFLFFQKYDPASYQKQAKFTESGLKGDVGYVIKLDNIEFTAIDWSVNRGDHGTLFVADPIRIPPVDSKDETEFKLIREIKYLNGRDTAFRIVEVK